MICVGIDLGTACSKVARLGADGKPEDIPNAAGQLTTPSCFLIMKKGGDILFGAEAENSALLEPRGFVSAYKRGIGDPDWGFDAPDGRRYSAKELSALALRHLIGDAERYLGEKVTAVTLTVPANFNDAQRREMAEVSAAVGVELLGLVNEPTSAALTYALQRKPDRPVLVYDLGGGTFDASLVAHQNGTVDVLASEGIARCGGVDLRTAIENHCLAAFEKELSFRPDTAKHAAFLQEVRTGCERAKLALTVRRETVVTGNLGGKVLVAKITRAEFEAMIRPLVAETIETCKKALNAGGLGFDAVDVVLVGGASRTPLVAQMLREATGRDPRADTNPDHAVARGAAIEAALKLRERGETATADGVAVLPPAISKVDVSPYPLGVLARSLRSGELRCVVIVPKNNPLPALRSEFFDLEVSGQDRVQIVVVQGDPEAPPDDCHQIGDFIFFVEPRGPLTKRLRVDLAYDLNGMVKVTATDMLSGKNAAIDVRANGQTVTP